MSVGAVFDKFDANDSGYLDHRELRSALRQYGIDVTTREAMEVLAAYDDKSAYAQTMAMPLIDAGVVALHASAPAAELAAAYSAALAVTGAVGEEAEAWLLSLGPREPHPPFVFFLIS